MGVRSRWQTAWWEDSVAALGANCANVVKACWHLGVTGFGGPPVHFKIFYDKFVNKIGWIDEQTYQELFSVSQALTGPGSTKMLYCINLIHEGFIPALLGFFIWSLPGALGMLGLSIGVSNIGDELPGIAYALLSGLNAAVVGIIALAAVELSHKAITDKLTRIIVFIAGAAGMLYNALWYFPLLMAIAGIATVIHDFRWLHAPLKRAAGLVKKLQRVATGRSSEPPRADENIEMQAGAASGEAGQTTSKHDEPRVVPPERRINMSWKVSTLILCLFLVSFTVVMVLRGVLFDNNQSLLFNLFANMYLAGTIIFGGGPVVIPLLREYVVAEGWVSPRDFLIGLAIIQAFPGPNFNFAVYLGGLTAINGGYSSVAGAVLGFVGIFTPGMVVCHGVMGIWNKIRGWRAVRSVLRGFNAAATGLIYSAVYRLWQIGYIDEGFIQGTSLSTDPWWVVITATSYVGSAWFGVSAPLAIATGAVMGLIRYGVVG